MHNVKKIIMKYLYFLTSGKRGNAAMSEAGSKVLGRKAKNIQVGKLTETDKLNTGRVSEGYREVNMPSSSCFACVPFYF